MVTVQIIVIVVMAAGVAFLAYVIFRSLLAPKHIEGIKKLTAQGKYAQAVKLAKSLINKNTRDFEAHYYLALAYLADNKPELALMELKFINQNAVFDETRIPEAEFRHKIASLYIKFNQSDEALKEYLLLTKLEPGNPDNFYSAAKLLEQFNKSDQAMYFYKTTIKLNKKHAKAHEALGVLLFRNKQLTDAKKEIDRAISLNQDAFSAYYYQGKIFKELKDYPNAVNAFEKSLRSPEYKQRAFLERGSCFIAVNNIDRAVYEFDRAVKASKDDGSQETLYARYFLASCYEKLRKVDLAIEQWSKIYAKNKSFRDVAAKLSEYKDIQANDGMKEYLTTSTENFLTLCRQIVEVAMNLVPQNIDETRFGCKMVATEKKSDNWMTVRQKFYVIYFYRDTDLIEDTTIRQVLDEVKKQNYTKGIICTSASFAYSAVTLAENRPVELINREQLEQLLEKAGL